MTNKTSNSCKSRIAFYGKGGIGKSTIAANVSFLLSKDGNSVLHIGCDPKHDSTRLLSHGKPVRTFASSPDSEPLHTGLNGIGCVECGGGFGTGCAGKSFELLLQKISDQNTDYRVYDVLGDVVCGGFSMPARKENSDGIVLVTSGEFMSLYAANNILKGLRNINPTRSIIGIVLNRRGENLEEERVKSFAEATGIPIIGDVPRSPLFSKAEAMGEPLSLLYPNSREASSIADVVEFIMNCPKRLDPRPLSDDAMTDLAAGRPIRNNCYAKKNSPFHCSERRANACTSHGAADGSMRIRDAATILHGPYNCAYLMEYAFLRHLLYSSKERPGDFHPPGVYSTGLNAKSMMANQETLLDSTVEKVAADGYRYAFLIPTCTSEISGMDLSAICRKIGVRNNVELIYVPSDSEFLSNKFGGRMGLFDALVSRMKPLPIEKNTVNLISEGFYVYGRTANMQVFEDIFSMFDLRINTTFLDFCSMSDIDNFCRAEHDIVIGRGSLHERICGLLKSRTGRRPPLFLEAPHGLCGCLEWVRKIGALSNELSRFVEKAELTLRKRFEKCITLHESHTNGKRTIICCARTRDLRWQMETLHALGMDVVSIMFESPPENGYVYTDAIYNVKMCDLREAVERLGADVVLTDDLKRVGKTVPAWAPLDTRNLGMTGMEQWTETLCDCLRIKKSTWEAGL